MGKKHLYGLEGAVSSLGYTQGANTHGGTQRPGERLPFRASLGLRASGTLAAFVLAGLLTVGAGTTLATVPPMALQDLIEQDVAEAASGLEENWMPTVHEGELPVHPQDADSLAGEGAAETDRLEAQTSPNDAAMAEGDAPPADAGTEDAVGSDTAHPALPLAEASTDAEATPGTEETATAEGTGASEEMAMAAMGAATEGTQDSAEAGTAPMEDADAHDPLPSSPLLERQKAFWIHVFTKIEFNQGIIHDVRRNLPIYHTVDLDGIPYRRQWKMVRSEVNKVRDDLLRIADVMEAGKEIPEELKTLAGKIPEDWTPADVRGSAVSLRFQRGIAKRFREGIIRSGRYMEEMRGLMIKHRVPEDLVYLPMVESTYYNQTISKVGAAGMWQFTRGTARYYMTVNRDMDQRFDPLVSAEAAAKFLRQNRDKLGTWPLAITAYNHGPGSIARISKKLETTDLSYLIANYSGPPFGVASKNFYGSFLAAREVVQNYEKYFGPLEREEPMRYQTVKLPFYMHVNDAAKAAGTSAAGLRALNPGLRSSIWAGVRFIPKGYSLRIPHQLDGETFIAAVPDAARRELQTQEMIAVVAPGDSLYKIGRRFGVSWPLIAEANNIRGHRIRPGQKLIIPLNGKVKPKEDATLTASVAGAKRATPQVAAVSTPAPKAEAVAPSPARDEAEVTPRIRLGPGQVITVDKPQNNTARFQELDMVEEDKSTKRGLIVAAYGENMGLYADWANTSVAALQQLNQSFGVSRLQTGHYFSIPLNRVNGEEFIAARKQFHRQREAEFLSENHITKVVEVEVTQGQSIWKLTQQNRVPMWLFYRENPSLISKPVQAGMKVSLPVIQEIASTGNGAIEMR